MKIGHIDLGERPVLLAPMEDVTDPAFRLMCKNFGADMVYTEFVSADALIRSVSKTEQKLNISDEERPVAIQIYGKDTATMVEAARIVEEAHPDLLDLNFGCPVKRVAGKGAGAGMLQNIPKMLEITRAVVDAVNIPVTVKTRLGWDANSKIIVTLAEQLQDCGIAALTIHGRTRAQMYTGEADWTLIGEVKRNPRMRIPVIGNGHTTAGKGVLRPLRSGCHHDRPCQFRAAVDIQGSEALSGDGRRAAAAQLRVETGRAAAGGGRQCPATGRKKGHTARTPASGRKPALQGNTQFQGDAHRHAARGDQRRAVRDIRGNRRTTALTMPPKPHLKILPTSDAKK